MLRRVKKLGEVLANEGWQGLVDRVAWRMRRFVRLNEEFLCLELDLTTILPRYTARSRYTIRRLTEADYPILAPRMSLEQKLYYFLFRGAHEIGFGAFDGGRLVGHLGMGVERYHLRQIGLEFDLGPTTVYGNGLVVDPEYRKSMVTGALLEYAFLSFKEQGYRKCITITQTTNVSSLNMSAHFGFREIQRITSRRTAMIRRRPRLLYIEPDPSFESRKRPKRDERLKPAAVVEVGASVSPHVPGS
ncbi:MAG: GNAT family N-acetyltransferase [Nitrospiraceae bacterium]|nr:GNAT family N-acetyltransferase [Nitrospiraceae bacterium]